MRLERRLTEEEVNFLDLNPRKKPKIGNPKYLLDEDQLDKLHKFRARTDNDTKTGANDYLRSSDKPEVIMSAWGSDGRMMDIDAYCLHYNLPRKDITSYKLVSHTGTPYYNIVFKERLEVAAEEIDFQKIFEKYAGPPAAINFIEQISSGAFDRAVITDLHIGMEPNPDGLSLYGGKWDAEEVEYRRQSIVNHILRNRRSGTLIIDDLGDLLDGYNGETVRQGHELPQNMTNEEAFDCALGFKIRLVDDLAPHYSRIELHNINDDNHAGSFAYMVNSAFKTFIEARYEHVNVINVRTFIYHYFAGKNCFIITHGKDGKNLKFGFKATLDPKSQETITNYIEEHELNRDGAIIQFDKGDSHQFIFDYTTSDLFDYMSYPAASPSSNWVQTNFKKGRSGFVFFNYHRGGSHSAHPLFFAWDRNRAQILERVI